MFNAIRSANAIQAFWEDESGQHLVEYAILLCWMTLMTVSSMNMAGRAMKGAWSTANSDLTAANNTILH